MKEGREKRVMREAEKKENKEETKLLLQKKLLLLALALFLAIDIGFLGKVQKIPYG